MNEFTKTGNIVDIFSRKIFYGSVTVLNGRVSAIKELDKLNPDSAFIMPGFIDSHVHVESSMLIPSEFARLAVVHGTVGTISDPHEIANVCGMEGVEFMIRNGKQVPFKFYFGAPSCVPATIFETAGSTLNSDDVDALLSRNEISYLSEMMNFPGVLQEDEEVMKKIASAKKYCKPVDGHAPGLRGEGAKKYIAAGISTDHECFTKEEAAEKLSMGMKILIREGSAAKNFEALIGLVEEHYDNMMLCSDDKHPDSLAEGHINSLCARAVAKGIDIFKVLTTACINPVQHYNLDIGMLRLNDPADFIIVNNLTSFHVIETFIDGISVAEDGKTKIASVNVEPVNRFNCKETSPSDFLIKGSDSKEILIIEAIDGQLITGKLKLPATVENENYVTDIKQDILKIVVVNRYNPAVPAIGFIKNFGIKTGAIASSVAHDSHNIVSIGVDDETISRAVNMVIKEKGGISATDMKRDVLLSLPVGGLMSCNDGYQVADAYTAIDNFVKKELGSSLSAPFMTLSFMALLVIPHLKLSDKGLFDGDNFAFTDVGQ